MPLITFKDASFRKYQYTVFANTSWEMHEGEHIAITGANGSGKTTFLEAIEGRLARIRGSVDYGLPGADADFTAAPHRFIASVYFNDCAMNYANFYYQQRYHATETDGVVTVRKYLGLDPGEELAELEALNIRHLLGMEIIKLSNGQFKKMLIAKALLKKPRILLLDNLLTGLDAQARTCIADLLQRIACAGTHVIIAVNDSGLPDFITHAMEIEKFSVRRISTRDEYAFRRIKPATIPPLPPLPPAPAKTFETAVKLDRVTVIYGGSTILNHVEWTVRCGEKWALTGPNGAGKSILLSLIFADNPQAYANSIMLFDRKRGTGESIWDIKERIGFVSPEQLACFRPGLTCREVALSGLQENPCRRAAITHVDTIMMARLFDYFAIAHLADAFFQRISTGQQNTIQLIRAMLKNVPMLVLDEPFQGMDAHSIKLAKNLLNMYCSERTLIFVSHHASEIPACVSKHLNIEKGETSVSHLDR